MNLEECEAAAARMIWEERGAGREPTEAEWKDLMVEVRANRARIEQEALDWAVQKMAKPPRSGLWSQLYPQGVGWIFFLIVGAFVGIVLILFARR